MPDWSDSVLLEKVLFLKAKLLLFIESMSNKVHAQSQKHQHMRKLNKSCEISDFSLIRAVFLCS